MREALYLVQILNTSNLDALFFQVYKNNIEKYVYILAYFYISLFRSFLYF